MWQVWLVIAGACLVAEVITVGFLIFWCAIAALITMVVSFFTNNLIIQMAVFVISSGLLILATKPLVKKISESDSNLKTNVDSVVGVDGIVIEDIDSTNSTGQVKVNGQVWSAISENKTDIAKGTRVKVIQVTGVKLVVAPMSH